METNKEYTQGAVTIAVREIDGDLHINLPDCERIVFEYTGSDLPPSHITSMESCSSCGMPLGKMASNEFGDVYVCMKCNTPDFWVAFDTSTAQQLRQKASMLGYGVTASILQTIQQEYDL